MKTWTETVASTWLGDTTRRDSLQAITDALQGKLTDFGPMPKFAVLAEDVTIIGNQNRWYWCTTALCLCGEFLICAEGGTMFSSPTTHSDRDALYAIPLLEQMRNTFCHPAHATHVRALADLLESRGDPERAEELRSNVRDINHVWLANLALDTLEIIAAGTERRFKSLVGIEPSAPPTPQQKSKKGKPRR